MKIGYVRCSTAEQNEERQLVMMREAGVEKIYTDKASGSTTERTEFKKMMSFIREGDTLVTESISRIARNTRDLLSIVAELNDRQIEFVSLKESIDTATPQGRFVLTVFAALAELERESMLERQREGIEVAKAAGRYAGRKPRDIDAKQFESVVKRWRGGQMTAVEAMKLLDLPSSTFYRKVKEIGL